MSLPPICPLCFGRGSRALAEVQGRSFFDCPACGLVHVRPQDRPAPEVELAEYELHQNDSNDPGYRRFLGKLADPLLARLRPGAEGLDFGSGPGPTLSVMLEEAGMKMSLFDPYYAPSPEVLGRTYDFISCTEAAEHFFQPRREFNLLWSLLRPRGVLAVMTELLTDDRDVSQWAYARDPTHVCFYRERTWLWLAQFLEAKLERPHPNVALLTML